MIVTIVLLLLGYFAYRYTSNLESLAGIFATAFVFAFLLLGIVGLWIPGKPEKDDSTQTMARKPRK
ncbi:hypothetical protein A2380_00430 [candidate division WWE3 bacterium RIFOXYB1_FULL_43_24]|nr:MAG: hypothetical protein A2380_00430 [candidate division WWE3 bacterium RIFOXYB1_FULL_43_24]OGC73607.1 MAG: hypothetical protein A2414_02210 [candidate division WWE3 bacterium RIFOXYC1_FULL_42_13]